MSKCARIQHELLELKSLQTFNKEITGRLAVPIVFALKCFYYYYDYYDDDDDDDYYYYHYYYYYWGVQWILFDRNAVDSVGNKTRFFATICTLYHAKYKSRAQILNKSAICWDWRIANMLKHNFESEIRTKLFARSADP